MAIEPVNIPNSAGISHGVGDVRHFADGDAVDVPGISNPTRHLAERDNLLASKLNEVIGVVNNREQYVPLSIPRTAVPPDEEIVIVNQRIPEGFEARVLSAAVSSQPDSTDIELNIYYSSDFGSTSGELLVSTSSEYSAGVKFYPSGEFIISLKNKGSVSLDLATSVLLTYRPIGAQGALLVGSTVRGERGLPGPAGARGATGSSGSGTPGSPGMTWRSVWYGTIAYAANDVVSRSDGTKVSSYIAKTANTALDPLTNPSAWDLVANGATGATGSSGSSGVVFAEQAVNGTIFTGATYSPGSYNSEYTAGAVSSANTKYNLAFREAYVTNTGGTDGLSHLSTSLRTCFKGAGTIHFPQKYNGAKCDFVTDSVHIVAASNGTSLVFNGTSASVAVTEHHQGSGYIVTVVAGEPIPMTIYVSGAQRVV